jgi:hypothetical protein
LQLGTCIRAAWSSSVAHPDCINTENRCINAVPAAALGAVTAALAVQASAFPPPSTDTVAGLNAKADAPATLADAALYFPSSARTDAAPISAVSCRSSCDTNCRGLFIYSGTGPQMPATGMSPFIPNANEM